MIVAEMMTQGARSCRPGDSLTAAAQIMWEQDCGSVPIVDHDGQLLGMITDRDLCMAAYLRGQRLDECAVGDVMSRPAVACRPGDPIEKAEIAMREHRIRRLPIVDEKGRLNGILSLTDLVLASPFLEYRSGDVCPEALVSTMATICQHRKARAAPGA